jgi:hypothetical protein
MVFEGFLGNLTHHGPITSLPVGGLPAGGHREVQKTVTRNEIMNTTNRILLSVAILLVDLGVFFVPLTAFFLIYILMFNPAWFREFLDRLDGST